MPTVAKLETGAYTDIKPVAVVSVANEENLRRAFRDAIARKNAIVPNPPKDDWPPPVLLRYAGVKTWSALRAVQRNGVSKKKTEGTKSSAIERIETAIGWKYPTEKTDFPQGATVDDVIGRMIAILQDAAQK